MAGRKIQADIAGNGTSRLRTLVGIGGAVYLAWWFLVELTLPSSFNPLPGRLAVVATSVALVAASYRSRWVERRLSALFTAWACGRSSVLSKPIRLDVLSTASWRQRW